MAANSDKTVKRGRGKPFQKGQSGNPSGRPKKDPEIAEILKAALPEVARKLVELAESEDPRIALPACKEILDRTQGKPESMSKIELSGELAVTPAVILNAIRERRNGH